MRAGLVRQALRKHPWSFFGPFSTQTLGAAIVSGSYCALFAFNDVKDAGELGDLGAVFLLIAVYLAILIVGLTMSSTIARQARDIALLRTIGATPGRVQRAVAIQTAVVAVPAVLVGVPLGMLGGRAWVHGLVAHGVVPAGVGYRAQWTAFPVALGIAVVTSLIGAMVATIRPARARPARALADTAAPARRFGMIRTGLGIALVVGGMLLSLSLTDQFDQRAFLVFLAQCVGAGFLGPVLLGAVAPIARWFGRTGTLAAENIGVRAKALSGALVPLVLCTGFALVKVAAHTSSEHLHGVPDSAADLWGDYSGTAVYAGYAALAALNTLVTLALSRRTEFAATRLAGASRGRIIGIVGGEVLIVTGTGLLAAAGVAAGTLVPVLGTTLYVPVAYLAVGALAVLALVTLGTVAPTALLLRRSAVEAAGVGT